MSITTTGYSVKRFSDIIAEIRQELIVASGNQNLDLSDDSILGIINNIYSLKLSELHELAQVQWSAGDLDTATDVALDRLVARGRISRLQPVKAYGDLHFTDTIGKTINTNSQVKDLAGNVVQTLSQITLDNSGVSGAVLNITAVNNFTYQVTINSVIYSYTADSTATISEIINGLTLALSSNSNIVCSNVSNRLSISVVQGVVNITTGNNLSFFRVTKPVLSEALVASTEDFEAGTLIYPVTNIGSTTVTNLQKWVTGRLLESDAELRARFKASVGGQGYATVNAIFARLASTDGVISAIVEENWTLTTNSNGLPAKSIECTVKGGSDQAVANTIWTTKPAGIETHGQVTATITDIQGNPQAVKFTRPVDAYIHVDVQYSLYNEEIFPSDGPTQIALAVKNFGDSLGLNNDVIPQRIIAAIYNSVAGIGNIVLRCARTTLPSGTPVYSTNIIPIARKEEAVFDVSRITVTAI